MSDHSVMGHRRLSAIDRQQDQAWHTLKRSIEQKDNLIAQVRELAESAAADDMPSLKHIEALHGIVLLLEEDDA